MKKQILLILTLVTSSFLFAQTDDTQKPPPLMAPWKVVEVAENPGPIPYPVVREIDVMWERYIWREIDLREKRNLPLYFPTEPQGIYKSLGQLIIDAIDMNNPDNDDALPVYTDENCNVMYQRSDVKNLLVNIKTGIQVDPESGEPVGEYTFDDPLTASEIMYYRLKEVWYFDKNKGELNVRILSIEPFFEVARDGTSSGDDENEVEQLKNRRRLGVIRYDELRPFLAQQPYFTPQNSALKITFDDVLTWKRYFASYIIAEGNEFNNREIQDYMKNQRDQRIESDRISEMIRNYEAELWEY
jgi:gliding motility associated protien GldN